MEIGFKIIQLRLKRGMSQSELAKASGVKQSAISKIESGKTNPKPETIRDLARALEVSYEYLAEQTGRLSESAANNIEVLARKIKEMEGQLQEAAKHTSLHNGLYVVADNKEQGLLVDLRSKGDPSLIDEIRQAMMIDYKSFRSQLSQLARPQIKPKPRNGNGKK